MKKKENIHSSVKLNTEELERDLVALRSIRGEKSSHLSTTFWNKAVKLCRKAPVSIIAKGIGVSKQGLYNHINNRKKAEKNSGQKAINNTFMEISADALAIGKDMGPTICDSAQLEVQNNMGKSLTSNSMVMPNGSLIELERHDGMKLRVHLQSSSLEKLINQFMR